MTFEVGTRLIWVQPVQEVIEVHEDGHIQVRDQWGSEYAIHPDDLKRYAALPSEEDVCVKAAAADDWQERDLRRESLNLSIASRKAQNESFEDTVARAKAFHAYLKGEQA